ncbi:MAG TPA: SRPBCC family protein [Ktedonobacteraceae bacterium]|nr:SRPBCC family protein [Ktedonobacteraceae bacterium]
MAGTGNMVEHHASVTVNAPVHQVYSLFTHFNDFPKFMSFVKEVTYYDDQRSHWVADVVGEHQWDAVNENWVEDQQIAWRSYNGMENAGKVTFQPTGTNQTRVDVYIDYSPPAGVLGNIGEKLGGGRTFQSHLQHDLDNFARMVDQAPPGALDPESSNYLFHGGSAAAKGTTTSRQDATMGREPDIGSSTPTTPGGTYNAGAPVNPGQTTGQTYSSGPMKTPPSTGETGAPMSSVPPANISGLGQTTPATGEVGAPIKDVPPANPIPTTGDTYNTGQPYNSDIAYTGSTTGATTDRPIMDQDIINEPVNTTPDIPGSGSYTGPQGGINRNPVMPPDTGSTGTGRVMPPETNNSDPNVPLPPERDIDKDY